MNIRDILNRKKTLSFEVFPPKKNTEDLNSIYKTLDNLKMLNPDFISVTYGAGGSNSKNTAEIAGHIKEIGIEPLAHLTGGPSKPEQIKQILAILKSKNIENILALRGDKPQDFNKEYCKYFKHATDLIQFINNNNNFSIGAACYPEGHPESDNFDEDIKYLKQKEDLGAKFFITQLFYDNKYYYELIEKARSKGVNSPIIPGLMPLINPQSITRIIDMCGTAIPSNFKDSINKYKHNTKVLEEIGISYCVYQVIDLLTYGAPGIHLYIMNNSNLAKQIHERLINVFSSVF